MIKPALFALLLLASCNNGDNAPKAKTPVAKAETPPIEATQTPPSRTETASTEDSSTTTWYASWSSKE